jgi:hypothetical protein
MNKFEVYFNDNLVPVEKLNISSSNTSFNPVALSVSKISYEIEIMTKCQNTFHDIFYNKYKPLNVYIFYEDRIVMFNSVWIKDLKSYYECEFDDQYDITLLSNDIETDMDNIPKEVKMKYNLKRLNI